MTDPKKAHPGAFCTLGETGESKAGTPMVCSVRVEGVGERARWRRDPNAPAPIRRARGTGRRSAGSRGSLPAADTQKPLVEAPAPVARPEPHPDPDALLDGMPVDVQREIARRAGDDPRKAEELADAFQRDGKLPEEDPGAAAYDKAKQGIPRLSDEELEAAANYPGASPAMRDALRSAMDTRHAKARQAREDAELDAARKFRSGGSDDDLAAARAAAPERSAARRELDRQAYVRGLNDDDLKREAAKPMSDFDREQYGAEFDRRGLPRREAAGPMLDVFKTNDAPMSPNMWGAGNGHPVGYHPDGPWGGAVRRLGPAQRIDYDGKPLAEHLNRVATDVIDGRRTTNDAIGELRRVRDRIPEGHSARRTIDNLIDEIDYPMTPVPEIPAGTHPAVEKMIRTIHSVPAARRDPSLELEPALEIARQMAARPTRNPRLWAFDLERACYNNRHESTGAEGKWDIDRAVRTAIKEINDAADAKKR